MTKKTLQELEAASDDELRCWLALRVGWTYKQVPAPFIGTRVGWRDPNTPAVLDAHLPYVPPDFPGNRDECAKIEALLSALPYSDKTNGGGYYSQQMRYSAILTSLVKPGRGGTGTANMFADITASPRLRTIALIYVLQG